MCPATKIKINKKHTKNKIKLVINSKTAADRRLLEQITEGEVTILFGGEFHTFMTL